MLGRTGVKVTYDAFISYSHSADGALGPTVQEVLQRLAKPWYRRRALHVFRDDTGLSATPALWSSIATALDESEWFILLASPDAAASAWVNREVEHWLTNRDRARILPVLTDGTLVWDAALGDFDPDRSTALPPALTGAFAEEPKHIDLTWARQEEQLDVRSPRLRDQVAALAAPIHGVPKDDLEGADLREHRRTMRVVRAVVVVLVLLAGAAGVSAVAATRNAQRARVARDDSDYRRVIAQSRDLRSTNRTLALLLAVEARHIRDTPQSLNALESALVADPRYLETIGDGAPLRGAASMCLLDRDRVAWTGGFDGTFGFTDLRTGRQIGRRQKVPGIRQPASLATWVSCVTSRDRRHAVVVAGTRVWALDVAARRLSGPALDLRSPVNQLALSPDGRTLLAGTVDGRVVAGAVDPRGQGRRLLTTVDRPSGAAFSPDGRAALTTTKTEILVWDTATWKVRLRIADAPDDQGGGFVDLKETSRLVQFSPDGRFIADSRRAVFRVIEATTGGELWRVGTIYVAATPFTFAADSKSVFTPTSSGGLDHLDARRGKALGAVFDTQEQGFVVPAVTEDGATLVVSSAARALIQRWALDGRSAISRIIHAPGMQPNSYSPDGRALLAVPAGKLAVVPTQVFDVASGHLIARLPTSVLPTLLSSKTMAGYFIDELKVDRIDLASGRRVGLRFAVDISHVTYAAVERAGGVLLTNNDGTVDRYAPDGRTIGKPWLRLARPSQYVVISPKGDLVALMDDQGTTRIVQLSDRRVLTTVRDFSLPNFTADGSLLTGFSTADKFLFVDPRTGREVGDSVPITGRVTYSDFGPRQMFVLAGSAAQVYDLATRQPITDFFDSTGAPVAQPGGRQLATSTATGIVLWDLDPDHWEKAACAAAGRNLTHAEWTTYFPNSAYRLTCSL